MNNTLPVDAINEENIRLLLAGGPKDRLPVLHPMTARRVSIALLKPVTYRTPSGRISRLYNESGQGWQGAWDWLCQQIPLELAQKLLAS